jgi:phosphoesterase RecJ-like protein
VLATALSRLEHVPDADLVWTHVRQADVAKEGITLADTDDLIDVIRTAREADVACVIKEQRDGRLKVSLRSRGASDLAAIAARHGGGGHRLAAGYTSKSGLEQTIRELIEDLRKAKAAHAAS